MYKTITERPSSKKALSGHINNFNRWKKDLTRSLKSFRLWLGRNQLYSAKVDKQLSSLLSTLKDDYVTIAFTGEFSRGKTELINAMFFAKYGQRVLPSQAGRTTMCPTELFYDQQIQETYLRLLPIETRSDPRPLTEFRYLKDYWLQFSLDTTSADTMASSLLQVTETKWVTPDEATNLGFTVAKLELIDGKVEIPKWRHALVSFDHPLLMKGLCILDTPGLNALGSEPELTLSLLPRAQAVIFLLAADAGVTASDMDIWDEHISQLKKRSYLGLYAVLNKVDVLWDDLSTDQQIEDNINKVIESTARQLEISKEDVIPVSAQKGLVARVKDDADLFAKSRLKKLEDVLSNTVMLSKERNLWDNVISDARIIVDDSLKTIINRRQQLVQQRDELDQLKDHSSSHIETLLENCKKDKQQYQQKTLLMKPSIRLIERQTLLLKQTLSSVRLKLASDSAATRMIQSKSTRGMLRSMREYFFEVDTIMVDFCREAELTNKMTNSVYVKFQEQQTVENFIPRDLTAKQFHQELKNIIRDSDQFNRHLKLAFSGHDRVVERFFNTTVYNINSFFERTTTKLDIWTKNILHPLTHQINDHKTTLDEHMNELLAIQKNDATTTGRLRALNTLLKDQDHELIQCRETLSLLNEFKPVEKKSNILQFNRDKLFSKQTSSVDTNRS